MTEPLTGQPSTEAPPTEVPLTEVPSTEEPPEEPSTDEPTEEPSTDEPSTDEPTVQPPAHGVCPKTCKHTFCKKQTAASYEVIDVKAEYDFKIVYNVRLLNKYKGLPSDLNETTLEVPKSNKKHKIEPSKRFLFMSSGKFEGKFVLNKGCFNKHLPMLSFLEQTFLNGKPIEYCEKRKRKNECRIKGCVKKCCKHCSDCDDEETCVEDCKTRCQQISWFNLYRDAAERAARWVPLKSRLKNDL